MTSRQKRSLIAGALTSSLGIFISKTLGLLYVAPLNALATEANMMFYSTAYTYYDLLLNICSAGFPFAIAALVAKYYNREDYRTVLLVRKLSMSIMLVSGFTIAMLFLLISHPLAGAVMGADGTADDIRIVQTTFMILTVSLVFVPFLSSFRGFYQGLKEMQVYAVSQTLEQIVRIIFMLAMGYFFVVILKFDHIWAIYMAVLASAAGALIAIVYYQFFDRKQYPNLAKLARQQAKSETAPTSKEIIHELFLFGLPYLLSTILGNSMSIVNSNFFLPVASSLKMDYESSKLALGIIQTNCNKLTSIPQVLALGFSSSVVPYITQAYENRDYKMLRRNILDCYNTVLYIALFLCFGLFVFARPIYFILFPSNTTLDLGTEMLQWSTLLGITGVISPITNSILMTVHQRKRSLLFLALCFATKCITFYPLVALMGNAGAITSSVLAALVTIVLGMTLLAKQFHFSYKTVVLRAVKIFIALVACNGAVVLLQYVFPFTYTSKVETFMQLAVYGVMVFVLYIIFTLMMKLPQSIFMKKRK